MKLKLRKEVFMVVFRNNKYLILKRKLHWHGWECPKGGIEKGESLTKAVKRELIEETGLKTGKIYNLHRTGKFMFNKSFHEWPNIKGVIFHLFAVEAREGRIKIDNKEHSGFKWLEYEKAYKILTWPDQKKVLKLVNDRFNK